MRSRRDFSLLLLLSIALLFWPGEVAAKSAKSYLVYVGTYTQTGSEGIYVYSFDATTGEIKDLGLAAKTLEPSFLAIHPNGKLLYAVNETDTGEVSAFSIDRQKGKLTFLNTVATRGAHPAHITVDKTGRHVLVANYTGGNIAVFPVLADGRLGEASDVAQHTGSSVNPERQKEPHAHAINMDPSNQFAVAVDLGLDQVIPYRFDATTGKLQRFDEGVFKVSPGAGPRHIAFHPNGKHAYVINELDSTITATRYPGGRFAHLQTISTLPKGFKGTSYTAEVVVHPSGKFVYGSNRGHDSIAAFKVERSGKLRVVSYTSTEGKRPRNFAIDPSGTWLLAANQDTGNIVLFHINQATGDLVPTGKQLKVSSPVCIRLLPI